MMKKLWFVLFSASLVFILASFVAMKVLYDRSFPRYDRHDDTVSAALRYQDIEDEHPRELVNFMSGRNQLQGYIYPCDEAHGLIVIAHGTGGGADSYLPYAQWFLRNGWAVFMYDATGSFDSEGKSTRGIPQSLFDLEAALNYVSEKDTLNTLDLMLFGHSWGGYAVANALHLDYDIKAVVSVAAPNSASEIVFEQARRVMGVFALSQRPFLWLYQRMLFGEYAGFDAIDAFNQTDLPVMIIHGVNDEMVSYTGSALIAKQDKITNPNIVYKLMTDAGRDGHNNLFRSDNAIAYIDLVNEEYRTLYHAHDGQIPYEVNQVFYAGVDRFLVHELHEPLMQDIHGFYLRALD